MEIKKAFDNIHPINYIFNKIKNTIDFHKRGYSLTMDNEGKQTANKAKDIWHHRKVTPTEQS